MTAPDVIVVGGGVIGLSVARAAARRGLGVRVLDAGNAGAASGVGAGMLAPVTEAHYGEETLLRLNLAAAAAYPSWIAELEDSAGVATGYRACGTLTIARDADENAALDEVYRFQRRLGLDVERLGGRACRELEPALAPRVRGGIVAESDHQVDGQALLAALRGSCERAGVAVTPDPVGRVDVRADSVQGVELGDGTYLVADRVVVAAGCWSGRLPGLPPGLLPVRPVKGQLLRLQARREPAPVSRVIRGLGVYLVPRRDGRLVIGATVEEQGDDLHVTAGGVHQLLRDAYELVPGIIELDLTEAVAGLRPGTPDNAPLLGETGIRGLIAATGHFRNGILLAPVTGDDVAELLATGTTPPRIESFSPQRFASAEVMS